MYNINKIGSLLESLSMTRRTRKTVHKSQVLNCASKESKVARWITRSSLSHRDTHAFYCIAIAADRSPPSFYENKFLTHRASRGITRVCQRDGEQQGYRQGAGHACRRRVRQRHPNHLTPLARVNDATSWTSANRRAIAWEPTSAKREQRALAEVQELRRELSDGKRLADYSVDTCQRSILQKFTFTHHLLWRVAHVQLNI